MKSHTILTLLLVGLSVFLHGQSVDADTSTSEEIILWHEAKALFPTIVQLPDDFDPMKPHSLILALHGYGSSSEAFQRKTATFAMEGFIVALPEAAYPMLNDNGELGYDWWLYQLPDQMMHKRALSPLIYDHLPAVVKDLQQKYLIDNVYVFGFSQGALTAYLVGIYNHDLFDGIIAFGAGTEADWYEGNTLASGKDTKVLIVQGETDERTPLSWMEQSRDLLINNGYDVTYRTFDGGHIVPGEQINFAIDWIKGNKK